MIYKPEDVGRWVRNNFPCRHEHIRVFMDGHCMQCGCIRDDFVIHIRRGDAITQSSETRHAFVLNHTLYFYEEALRDLGLLDKATGEWQSVEAAESKTIK